MQPVEIRYLDVVWSNPETVIKLEYSREALELEQTSSGWFVETITFPSTHHYIGICIKESKVKHTPYFKLADGSRQELMSLKAPGSDDIWWIQSGGWNKKSKRYLSELYRTAGRAELIIQSQRLIIENNTFNFTVPELEYYLSDFKNNLWMLILNDSSTVKGNVGRDIPDCFNDEVISLFHDFIQSAEKIIKKPGMILTETQEKQPIRSVRPVPRTFREYVTKPNAKMLTSRTYRESYDTPENRFIHYCVKRVLYILKSLYRVASAQSRSYTQKIEQMHQWKQQFQKGSTKRIDARVYDNEIKKIEQDLTELNQGLAGWISNGFSEMDGYSYEECRTCSFQMGKNYGRSTTGFFSNRLNGEDFRRTYGTYLVVKFPEKTDETVIRESLCGHEVEITGRYVMTKRNNSKGNQYVIIEFREVTSISVNDHHPLRAELLRLINHREKLKRDDWVVPLTSEELQDLDMENEVASKKIRLYDNLLTQMEGFASSLPVLQSRLAKVASFFNENKVKTRSDCPNTMVFIQNPSYASAKSLFRKISALNGLDEFMLNSLMVINEIGLVNVANLYEKWCLLQIIKVLHQVYRFDIEEDWQQSLISSVLKKIVDIDIKFQAPERQQSIILTYEKVLNSGKRPDFVIELISNTYDRGHYGSPDWVISGEKNTRLVLDAKFRGAMSEDQLNKLVSNLYTDKDYSEGDTNQVFVIHPSPEVIKNRTSPLVWGSQCDYGQSDKGCHRYGSIFTSPSLTHFRSLEHLQRLVGLFLQENSVILYQQGLNAPFWHNMGCICCGNTNNDTLKLLYSPTGAGSERWLIKCEFCGLLTVKTICSACHRPLFKNGPKWTYHRTRAEQMSNVVCPRCETFL